MRGRPRITVRMDPDLWDAFGQAASELDPAADRSELLRHYVRWFLREPGVRQPPRKPAPGHDASS